MKKMIASFCVVAFLALGFVSCQVYDQDTNEVVYTAMPLDGPLNAEDVVKDIEKALKGSDATADVLAIGKKITRTYTGKDDAGNDLTPEEMAKELEALWAETYTKWDFTRK